MAWTEANFQTTIGNVASNHGGLTAIKSIEATPYLNSSDPTYNGGFKVLVIMKDGFQYSFLRQAQDKGGFDTFMGILKTATGNNATPVNQSVASVLGTITSSASGNTGIVNPDAIKKLESTMKAQVLTVPYIGDWLQKGNNLILSVLALAVAAWYFFFKRKKRGGRRRRRR